MSLKLLLAPKICSNESSANRAAGQLGQADRPAPEGELISTSRKELDLTDKKACHDAVTDLQPDWVLNAGAYTAVDKAESNAFCPPSAGAPEASPPR